MSPSEAAAPFPRITPLRRGAMTAITACHDLARSRRPGRGSPLALARRRPGPGISLPSDCREMIRRGALVAVDSGGGKDSQCMTILLSSIVPREQMVVVHTPLAEVEWPGTIEHIDKTLPDGVPLMRRGRLESSRRRPFDDPSRPPCRACYLPRKVPQFCRANRRTAHTPSTPKISRPILSPEFILSRPYQTVD